MSTDVPPLDLMNYGAMQQDALRGVVRVALQRAAIPRGLPGDHHFYISFRTDAPGVSAPPEIISRYPEEMTIVLQNQFWDLIPGDDTFSVTLHFGGQPKALSVPYRAITRFYDPSVRYLLQFDVAPAPVEAPPPSPKPRAEAKTEGGDEPKVVSLDQFRKK